MKSAFFPSSEKVGQSLLRPESAESELLAPSAPGHSTPALAMEGAGTEAWGAQAQLVEMLSLAWPLSTPSEPHLATIPGSARSHLFAGTCGLGLGWVVWRDGECAARAGPTDRAAKLTVLWGRPWSRPSSGLSTGGLLCTDRPRSHPSTCPLWGPAQAMLVSGPPFPPRENGVNNTNFHTVL